MALCGVHDISHLLRLYDNWSDTIKCHGLTDLAILFSHGLAREVRIPGRQLATVLQIPVMKECNFYGEFYL